MFSSSRSLFFTLFLALTLLIALAPTADANGNTIPAHRRQATRMLKKRAPPFAPPETDPSGGGKLPIGVGQDPDNGLSGSSTSTSTSASTGTSTSVSGKTTSSTSTSSSTATSTGTLTSTSTGTVTSSSIISTSTNSTSSTISTTSTTSSTSSTSSLSSSSSSSSTSSVQETLAVTTPNNTPASAPTPTTVTLTSALSATAAAESSAAATSQSATSSGGIGKATLTIIIVIASCIGGAIIVWTIIRKWKFSPSAEFEDRMQPIDWQPTVEHNARDDDGIPGSLRRVTSNASHGSFHSGSDHDGRAYNGYGAASDLGHSNTIPDLPSHDFTAGPANLAPVGGYADLARGPSPQPQMTEALGRGASMNRGYGYDTYGPRY